MTRVRCSRWSRQDRQCTRPHAAGRLWAPHPSRRCADGRPCRYPPLSTAPIAPLTTAPLSSAPLYLCCPLLMPVCSPAPLPPFAPLTPPGACTSSPGRNWHASEWHPRPPPPYRYDKPLWRGRRHSSRCRACPPDVADPCCRCPRRHRPCRRRELPCRQPRRRQSRTPSAICPCHTPRRQPLAIEPRGGKPPTARGVWWGWHARSSIGAHGIAQPVECSGRLPSLGV